MSYQISELEIEAVSALPGGVVVEVERLLADLDLSLEPYE